MGTDEGYVRYARRFFRREWLEGRGITPWSRQEAWMDMVQLANFANRPGQKRGEVWGSLRYFAGRWNWSRSRVIRMMQKWTTEGRIKVHSGCHKKVQKGRTTNRTTYVIVNYGTYQGDRTTNRTTLEEGSIEVKDSPVFRGKPGESVLEKGELPDDAKGSVGKSVKLDARQRRAKEAEGWFEDLWKGWPARVTASGNRTKGGKKEARVKLMAAARVGELPERSKVMWAMGRYRDHLRDSGELAMDLSRWVGKRRWDDWLEGEFSVDGKKPSGTSQGSSDYEALRRELGLTGDPVRRPDTPYPFE